ncbi:MAG: GGDEF domain-containing protein [Chloroflexi bacterium]|nr:GGDEF domain-containing protein [Chloroflexota bacterium]
METTNHRAEVLAQARRIVMEDGRLSPAERQELLALINTMSEASQPLPINALHKNTGVIKADGYSASHALLALLKQQADELDALKKLSLNLTSSLDLQTVLAAVASEAIRLVRYALTVNIFLYNDGKLEFGAALDQDGARNTPYMPPRRNGLTNTVAHSGEIIQIDDMLNHIFFSEVQYKKAGSIIGIPLMIDRNVVGVMNLSRSVEGKFSPSELRLLGLLADQAAVAISNASLHQIVSRQAYSDTVTGLPNRRALDERLEKEVLAARRDGYPFSVIMMDLDGFKEVNDTYGHTIGDQVLRAIFNYLATGMRSTDFLARYGGDELTLILVHTDLPAARLVTEKILERINQFQHRMPDDRKIKLGVSGGIAMYPIHAMSGADLLRAADEALYRAKKHERGSFLVAHGFTGPLSAPKIK